MEDEGRASLSGAKTLCVASQQGPAISCPGQVRAQGREVPGFAQPGVGLSHKGETNPESQSKLCNVGLKALTFANGLKRSQRLGGEEDQRADTSWSGFIYLFCPRASSVQGLGTVTSWVGAAFSQETPSPTDGCPPPWLSQSDLTRPFS